MLVKLSAFIPLFFCSCSSFAGKAIIAAGLKTPAINNEEAALQTYHADLGAYAYGNNADIDYVYCRVSAANNAREPIEEEWEELHTPPVVEPEET